MNSSTHEVIAQLQSLGAMPRPMHDYSTANFNDAMDRLGIRNRVLDGSFRPLLPYTKMVGTAVTLKIEACEADGSFLHEYAQVLDFGKLVPSPVLVIESPMGAGLVGSGIVYIMRRHYGFVGCVLDGLRDTDDLHDMKFQCYSRTVSPRYESGKLRGVSANQPVVVGGVTISAGDIVVGDNDGVVAVPRDELPRIMAAMHEDFENELTIFRYLDGGIPYLDAAKKLAAKHAGTEV